MSKHDTWVFLKSPSPYDQIKHFFPQGLPTRDPFPMGTATAPDGEQVPLWIVDMARLIEEQTNILARAIGYYFNVEPQEVIEEAIATGGFAINSQWIERMEVGAEGFTRTNELAIFLRSHAEDPPLEALQAFMDNQVERWIDGDEIPPPLPQSIDEVEPALRTPELEQAIERDRIEQALAGGNYSAMEVLTGKAVVDVLNQLNPDSQYDLVGWDDLDE